MVEWGNTRTPEALQIDGLIPDSTSCIAFCIEASALQSLCVVKRTFRIGRFGRFYLG